MKKRYELKLSGDRLSMFSDGVIAIIITLMIMGINIPDIEGEMTLLKLGMALLAIIPSLLAYAVSFYSLAIFWANHHNFFHLIKHIDRGLMWLNMNLLFWLSLIPLPTAFLAKHYGEPEGIVLYSLCMFMCNASFGVLFIYAKFRGLINAQYNRERIREIIRMIVWACLLWIVALFLGYVSVYLSYIIYAFISILFFLPKNIEVIEESEDL